MSFLKGWFPALERPQGYEYLKKIYDEANTLLGEFNEASKKEKPALNQLLDLQAAVDKKKDAFASELGTSSATLQEKELTEALSWNEELQKQADLVSRGVKKFFSDCKKPSSSSLSFSACSSPSFSPVPLYRKGCNCWANALMQMVMNTPALIEAFDREDLLALFIREYWTAQVNGTSLSEESTQRVRMLLNNRFPHVIRSDSLRQEDASEALLSLMALVNPADSRLFTNQETRRYYAPTGNSLSPEEHAKIIAKREGPINLSLYSRLGENNNSSRSDPEWQIFLDLESHQNLDFEQLLMTYFHNSQAGEGGWYLVDGRLHEFRLLGETRQFATPPQHFNLLLKRFDRYGSKIYREVDVKRVFTLPRDAIKTGERAVYELTSFFYHEGGYGGGHYYTYCRTSEGKWFCCNDSSVQEVSLAEVDRALKTSYGHHYERNDDAIFIPSPSSSELLLNRRVDQLKVLLQRLNSSASNEELKSIFYRLDEDLQHTFHRLVWEANPVNELFYGRKCCDNNMRVLLEIKKPLLTKQEGTSLIAQMIQQLEEKLQTTSLQRQREQLETFHALLKNEKISNQQLLLIFDQLDGTTRTELQRLVWVSHKPGDILDYGKKTIIADVRCLLKGGIIEELLVKLKK